MPDELGDNATRRRALDPSQSFIVQAPAGSGKTELLIRRFLALLACVSEPERVVAITFTRKAAAEMRERVIRALKQAAETGPHPAELRGLMERARAALDNDRKRNWQLVLYPSRLRIQTIDALCAALTRQMPWLSRLGAPMQVVEEADELYREAANSALHQLGTRAARRHDAIAKVIAHVDNNLPKVTELLMYMLRHRDQWLRHMGAHRLAVRQRSAGEDAWQVVVQTVLNEARQLIPIRHADALITCAAYAGQQISVSQPASPIAACRDLNAIPGSTPADLPAWRGIVELTLTRQDEWRRTVTVKHGFPPAANRLRQQMMHVLAALSDDSALQAAFAEIRRLPGTGFSGHQWQILQSLMELLPLAAAELQLLFREYGVVDFTEITESAQRALGDLEDPSELALRLDYRIEHLLVDEFQDTSVSQFHLLQQLTAGWQPGDGRTLFLVGDPMQSIYRFRDAEVGLFLHVMENGFGQITMQPLTLRVNFRSDRSIVAWVNETFAELFPGTPDSARGAVPYSPFQALTDKPLGPGVFVHPISAGETLGEAAQVVNIIRTTVADRPGGSVAILVRSRLHLGRILPALQRSGVECIGVDVEPLASQPVVEDLHTLARALIHPADRVAWLGVLRAPWCGLTLRDLFVVASHTEHRCVMESLHDLEVLARLSQDGRRRIQRVAPVCRDAFAARGRGGFRRWVENVWTALSGPACVDQVGLANAQAFFDLVEELEVAGDLPDLRKLKRGIARLWARASGPTEGRVQIMTMHKAKGLEFDTVIIPGLDRIPPAERKRLLMWEEYPAQGVPQLLLAPVSKEGEDSDPHYQYLRRWHRRKQQYETLRLLYVGCTRARHALHLLGCVSTDDRGALRRPDTRSLLYRLWPVLADQLNEQSRGPDNRQADWIDNTDAVAPQLQRLPSAWESPAPSPGVANVAAGLQLDSQRDTVEFSWVGETARQIGILVHDVMQRIADEGLGRWDNGRLEGYRKQWRGELYAQGVPLNELDSALERVMVALKNVLVDAKAQWILKLDRQDAHNEYRISAYLDGRLQNVVVDRTFIDESNRRWIIDYKTSSHEGAGIETFLDRERERYRNQLEKYAAIIAQMETRPICLGLYFPLLRSWREWHYSN